MSSKDRRPPEELVRRAAASYLKEFGNDWPTKHSTLGMVKGARYVVVRGARKKLLAVYRIDFNPKWGDQVRRIERWPAEVGLLGK